MNKLNYLQTKKLRKMENSSIIHIDRTQQFDPRAFDPTAFVSNGWFIEEQDEKAVALNEIDLNEVILDSTIQEGEDKLDFDFPKEF